ncbi:MAG: hypothetical protein JW857_00695, partial [Bacteroidales bacterium]|nr:hypothetical protein [Bacteroidales bacterium]
MPEFIFTEDEPSDNSSLWKFLNKDKFLSMILNQKLHLTRLDVFDDNNEGISANQILFERYSEYLIDSIPELNEARENGFSIEIGSSKIDSFAQELELFQKSNFANCWFISEDGQESAAMWNLFSSPNSAALKIKYKEFKKNLVESGL